MCGSEGEARWNPRFQIAYPKENQYARSHREGAAPGLRPNSQGYWRHCGRTRSIAGFENMAWRRSAPRVRSETGPAELHDTQRSRFPDPVPTYRFGLPVPDTSKPFARITTLPPWSCRSDLQGRFAGWLRLRWTVKWFIRKGAITPVSAAVPSRVSHLALSVSRPRGRTGLKAMKPWRMARGPEWSKRRRGKGVKRQTAQLTKEWLPSQSLASGRRAVNTCLATRPNPWLPPTGPRHRPCAGL